MAHMMSKPTQATGTVQQHSAYSSHSNHEPQCNNPIEKQLNHFLDSNLADIISNLVYNINLNNLVKSKKTKRRSRAKFPCSICTRNVNKTQKAIQCKKCQR